MNRKTVVRGGMSALALLMVPARVLGSEDTTPKPGGVYRLKPGIYAPTRLPCGSAPIPTLRIYDGAAIHDASTRSCRTTVRARVRDSYSVVQSCFVNGRVPRRATMERQTIVLADALSFSVGVDGRRTSYRYCPTYMLPSNISRVFR